jgi:hypothetical protein
MSRLSRAAGRGAARLLPAERRDWAEAIWAEASEVPSGLRRLSWYAGGAWLLAREPIMARRVGNSVLFATAATVLLWTAWPGTPSGLVTAFMWLRAITTIAVLAGLPLLVRRRLGPVTASRLARSLRLSAYAAITALIVALADLDRISNTASQLAKAGPRNQPSIGLLMPWSIFLLGLAGYAAVILVVTAQRSWVTPGTLAIGAGAGVALGVVMYAIMPLGFGEYATAPWLARSAIDPVVVLAWVLLLGGPLVAALIAGRSCARSGGPLALADARIRQGLAAGTLAAGLGSLLVCTLGPVTMALLPRADWLAHLLYSGQHLTAAAAVNRVDGQAIGHAAGYILIWIAFPLIGLAVGAWTALAAWGGRAAGEQGRGRGGGPGGPPPAPEPAPDGVSEDPADQDSSVAVGLFAATRVS